jgi:5-methylcytosine-specific restriction endonuclease McrA
MNSLEKETLKYEKKGFDVEQRRKLKHGTRTVLTKKGFLSSRIVYIYYVDGDVTNESLRECFKDYMRLYGDMGFDSNDKGLFLSEGDVDDKLFRDVRKAVIRDDDIRNSIKLVRGSRSTRKEPEKGNEARSGKGSRLTHDETEKIILRVGTICCYPNCKETISLDVHHIVPIEERGTNEDRNLIVLCPSHHRLADRGAIPRKRLEMHNVAKMEYKRL